MSMKPPPHPQARSALDRRIHSFIRQPHQNDLRVKDSFSLQGSTALRNESFRASSDSSLGSDVWSAIRESDSSFSLDKEEFSLQTCVRQGVDVVQVPEGRTDLGVLVIDKSICFLGSGDSTLSVTDGCILLRNLSSERIKVRLSQIKFEYTLTSEYLSSGHGLALFQVEENIDLELTDCTFTSLNHSADLGINVEDVCVWVAAVQELHNVSTVLVQSCQFVAFFEALHTGELAQIYIERSYFDYMQGDALFMEHPSDFVLIHSCIKKPVRSGVKVTFFNTPSTDLSTPQRLMISQCQIRSSGRQAILLQGSRRTPVPLSIEISCNYLVNSKKEGLSVKNLHLNDLVVRGNEMRRNKRTNCCIQRVQKFEGTVGLMDNQCYESSAGYGLFLYDTSAGIVTLSCFSNRLGGVFIGGSQTSEPLLVSITESKIFKNGANGVTVRKVRRGSLTISQSTLGNNEGSGVYGESEGTQFGSEVKIQNCHIQNNGSYGIYGFRVPFNLRHSKVLHNHHGEIKTDEDTVHQGRLSIKRTSIKKGSCRNSCAVM